MCGIVGMVAQRNVVNVLLQGLQRLEYRGYDSCGLAIHGQSANQEEDVGLQRFRSTEGVVEIANAVAPDIQSFTGIAHTRWATHGIPDIPNAHPHFSYGLRAAPTAPPRVAVVHNGIIENHEDLRRWLQSEGYEFHSQTDTEVVAHLVDHEYEGDLRQAARKAIAHLRGSYALAIMGQAFPHRIVATSDGSPLVLGLNGNETLIASDPLAFAGLTNRVIYLEDGDLVDIQGEQFTIWDSAGREVTRPIHAIHLSHEAVSLGHHHHFMRKEIEEQPQIMKRLLDTVSDTESFPFDTLMGESSDEPFADMLKNIDSILMLACGTSYYSACTAKYWLERLARIPVQVEIASEYRYRTSIPNPRTLVVTISQSGETADTLAALRHAKALGMNRTLTICNVPTSTMVRECRYAFQTQAGAEIGVASTKAFTAQLMGLFLLSLCISKSRGHLTLEEVQRHLLAARQLPERMTQVLALEPALIRWGQQLKHTESLIVLGRGIHFPIAQEGALKIKEVSYIHAEAYPAGELKHGPLALITPRLPTLVTAPHDDLFDKLKSNLQEVRARGGMVFALTDQGAPLESQEDLHVMNLPEHEKELTPLLHSVAFQLLAYHLGRLRGADIDKPRNLAKSVTVE
jgi:glucosamine--fructose-6-phosphate aminotransferase (isomerizing)